MRELKFRAWIQELEIMLYDIAIYPDGTIGIASDKLEELLPDKHEIDWDSSYIRKVDWDNDIFENVCNVLCGEDWIWFEENQYEIMQFTGLKDKNDKEIYEDNIMREYYGYDDIDWLYYIVKFGRSKDTRWGYYLDNYIACSSKEIFEKLETVGNTYQNPEFLK